MTALNIFELILGLVLGIFAMHAKSIIRLFRREDSKTGKYLLQGKSVDIPDKSYVRKGRIHMTDAELEELRKRNPDLTIEEK